MTVTEKMQKIAEEICNNYCKKPEEFNCGGEMTDEMWSKFLEEVCEKCPLSELV